MKRIINYLFIFLIILNIGVANVFAERTLVSEDNILDYYYNQVRLIEFPFEENEYTYRNNTYEIFVIDTAKVHEKNPVETEPPMTQEPVPTEKIILSKYAVFDFYVEEYEERYIKFHEKKSDFSDETIVWMVGANLDKPFFTDVNVVEKPDETPVLVNKYNKVSDDYIPANLVDYSKGSHLKLTQETKDAFIKMKDVTASEGYKISINSAYRTIAYQKDLYNSNSKRSKNVDRFSAKPGYSEHHTGRALDLAGSYGTFRDFEKTKEAKWIAENSYKFGFIVRYKQGTESITGYMYEPWHITFVGVDVATTMFETKIDTLEEYMSKYSVTDREMSGSDFNE